MEKETNLPVLLCTKLKQQYSMEDYQKIMDGYYSKRKVCFRINPLKATREEVLEEIENQRIKFVPSSFYEDAFYLENETEETLQKLPCYQEGKIYIQNFSSMLPPLLFEYTANKTILDMTAAPGGKTSEMASLSKNKVSITACERDTIRFERLKYNLQKQGATRCCFINRNALDLDDFFSFDQILLDAPCSGSGTIQLNNKNSTYQFNEKYLSINNKRQSTLLNKAIQLLKKNEMMIYSTCSILKDEDEEILMAQIKKNVIQIVPIEEEWFQTIPTLPTLIPGTKCVLPTELFEGFFVAKIRKIK